MRYDGSKQRKDGCVGCIATESGEELKSASEELGRESSHKGPQGDKLTSSKWVRWSSSEHGEEIIHKQGKRGVVCAGYEGRPT